MNTKKYIWMFLLALAGIFNVHAQATLSMDNFKIKPGEEKEIAIKMTNTVPIRALQVQVTLPGCLTLVARPAIVAGRQGSYIDDFGETISAVKTLNYNKLNDGDYMITVNADDGVPFAGNEGAIITMQVKADESAALKESTITLQNIELVYEDGETYIRPSQSTCTVTVYQLFTIETVSSEGGTITGGGSYESGSKVTLTATPEDGYRFTKWSDGTTENPYTFTATDNKSLAATFESIPYYNIIYMVDGSEYKRVSVMSGSKISAETNPVKEGHSFTGWNGLPEIMPEQDVTVTGRFIVNSYEITYMLDGKEFKTAYIAYGTTITTPEVPAKEGYTFNGWIGVPEIMPAKNVTVTGCYTINKYTLTYTVDGETYKTAELEYGANITAEAEPTKEGHTFSGWSEIPATMPAKDVTITGTFTTNSYKVTYILDGETFKTEEVTYGTAIPTPEVPAKEGYNFSGWGEIPATMPAKELTFTGSYTINKDLKYNLIYMVDGVEYKRVTVAFGDAIVLDEALTKEGYTFSGWSEVPETMPLHDVTVTGTFTANSYTLTYVLDGETYKTAELEYGANITAEAAPDKEGHTFSGWSEIPATMPANNVTITGTFTTNSYKVTYILDGETFKTEEVTYGTAIPAPEVPAKEGYNFSGWGEIPATMPAKDLTFTGSYTINKDLKYNLIYMVDGVEYKRVTVAFGDAIVLDEALTKEGHTFSGWSEVPETMPLHDVTVTGTFTANSYTLTYVLDGETYKTTELEYGANITAEAEPTKEGHTFSGWSEIPATMPANNVTITGTFTANSYKVTYILDGETFKTEEVTYGTAIPTPEVPAKEGYNFSGWGEIPVTMPAKELTFTGSYTINKDLKYNLIYMVDGVEYKRVTVAFGDAIVLDEALTKEGHTFSGWSEVPETMPLHDVTVTGTFTANSYTLTYVLDGETYKTAELEYGANITAEAAPDKEGHTFSGWSEIPATMPAYNVTITGTFTANAYKVTYILDGETFKTEEVTYGTAIPTPEVPAKEGYNFSGWGEIPATMPAKDLTFTGSYTINKDLKYNLIYMVDGVEYKRVTVAFGDAIILDEALTKEGYTFSGWSEVPETMPLHDVTVTGTFTINTYTIIYMVDGEVYAVEKLEYGATISLKDAPAKEGYIFSGWSETPETMPARDVTVEGSFTVDGIESVISNGLVDVYTLQGVMVKRQIPIESLEQELPDGIYIINGKKMLIR